MPVTHGVTGSSPVRTARVLVVNMIWSCDARPYTITDVGAGVGFKRRKSFIMGETYGNN